MTHGKSHRGTDTRQRLIAAARPEPVPFNAAVALLGLIIVILVLGKSGAMV